MTLAELKKQITTQLDNFYIFTGPEIEVMRIYINKIASVRNARIQRLDNLSDLYSIAQQKSFLEAKRVLILSDSKEFLTNEKVWAGFESDLIKKDDIVILKYTNIDKRSKMYKHFKDRIVDFEPLEEPILLKYIQKQIDLSKPVCKKLIDICENDYSRILLEIDKVKSYKDGLNIDDGNVSEDECFYGLLEAGVIHQPPKDAIFDFVDMVCRRRIKESFELLQECYGVNESNVVLLSVLYNNFKQLLQVQSYRGNDIVNASGLTPYVVNVNKDRSGRYSVDELEDILILIRETEKSIKTGEIDEAISIEYILVNIL